MNTASYAVSRRSVVSTSRPVVHAPDLRIVPTPASSRGVLTTVFLCALIFLLSLCGAFYLNTRMVQGAYEIKGVETRLVEVNSRIDTLEGEAVFYSTSDALNKTATKYGMVPANNTQYLDIKSK